MIALHDFKAKVLAPLLRGESPAVQAELVLFAAQFDRPLDYLFESDRWDEVSGGAQRLTNAADKLQAILTNDGYSPDDLLHGDAGSVLALAHDRATAERWTEAVERALALETDLVTVSTLVQPVTTQQLTGGLYRAPRTVIGVPGVHDYQERINRYYGLDSPSTVPKDDLITRRRHFGEVVALAHTLIIRARESRQILPFYEALPFVVRCASCRARPAERLVAGGAEDHPICGVCLRKRNASHVGDPGRAALVQLEAVGLERVLEQQRSVAAYRRLYRDINEVLDAAIPSRATILIASGGSAIMALPADEALEAAAGALEAIALHYSFKPPLPFVAAVAVGSSPNQFRALYDLLGRMTSAMRAQTEGANCILDVRALASSTTFDRFRKPYSVDEARQLIAGIGILRDQTFPRDGFADLSDHVARGSAGLYYTFERSKLPDAGRAVLQRLERAWDMGSAAGPRFYAMLSDALKLARLSD